MAIADLKAGDIIQQSRLIQQNRLIRMMAPAR